MAITENMPPVVGLVRLSQVLDGTNDGIWQVSPTFHNAVCLDWGTCAAGLFRGLQDGKSYKIGGMYLEFSNSGAEVDPVPTIERNTTAEYYRELSGDSDFLRVPLIASAGSKSSSNFTGNNIATFYGQSAGVTGQRTSSPLTFSDASNSRVYGAALVAFADPDDYTQDLIISRIYFSNVYQVEKVAGSQIGITWSLTFA